MPRYWTVAEARAALPEVVALLTQLQTLLREQQAAQQAAGPRESLAGAAAPARSVNGHGSATGPTRYERESQRVLERLDRMGVQVKDLAAGLVDFPHLRGGTDEILLCYRLGEPDIGFWHDLHSGFAGRRSIDEL
jgi:hypothetical protein